MTITEISEKIETMLDSKRLNHSLCVMRAAVQLAKRYEVSENKCAIAGLAHDCAKCLNDAELLKFAGEFGIFVDNVCRSAPKILHAPIGAELARRELGITDEEILSAIRYHTAGCVEMTQMDKVVYVADYISEDRDFLGVQELRKIAFVNLNAAVMMGMDFTIANIISKNGLIYADTINARNAMILKYPEIDYRNLI
jgi:predicted HD superfamily hydrolase involved in NAD metabolism